MSLRITRALEQALHENRVSDVVTEAELQLSIVLTRTCREELIALLGSTQDPKRVLVGCMNLYAQAIHNGDTSVSFNVFGAFAEQPN